MVTGFAVLIAKKRSEIINLSTKLHRHNNNSEPVQCHVDVLKQSKITSVPKKKMIYDFVSTFARKCAVISVC